MSKFFRKISSNIRYSFNYFKIIKYKSNNNDN